VEETPRPEQNLVRNSQHDGRKDDMAPVDETLSLEDIAAAHTSLRQLMTGYWGARALHAAVKLGVFEALSASAMKASELAEAAAVDTRAAEMLLNALTALGLLEKEKDAYKNSVVSQVFLLPSSEYYQGQLIAMYADDWELWQGLDEAVRRGRPTGYVPPFSNDMVHAMHGSAAVTAPMLLKKVDLSRVKRVLDIGGGPGTYSVALAKARPDAQITIVETPQASLVTREYIEREGVGERVRIQTGDFHQMDFGKESYELILLSNVLQMQSTEEARGLLKKAFEAVVSEGQCIVNEFLLRDDKTGPLFSTLFSLHMLLHTPQGRTWSGWEVTDAMQTEGFIRAQIVPMDPTPYSLVVGTRP
jgi:predicted nicotinamide N-methyase